jgi:tripartite-type tricarboxylate transporter receptor subunit TctC
MKKGLKKVLAIVAVLGIWIFLIQSTNLTSAKDPDYPTKPINFYIAYGAGGNADLVSRAFCDTASKYLGQPFVPINKPGAAGTITAMAVMTAKPDGYALGTCLGANVFNAPFSDEAPYKDISGFAFIGNFGDFIYPLMVRFDAPWKTWQEFIEWARKNPKAAKIAITGAKSVTTQGFVLWQVEKREGVEFTYIPMKSTVEILSATLGGHVTMYGSTVIPSTVSYVKEGKLRILSYMGKDKIPGYENIPSFQDLYGFSIFTLFGVFGPKGMPEYILKKLDDAFANTVKDPNFIKVMNQMYAPIVYMDRIQMKKYIDETIPKVGEIVKGLKAEEAKEKK